MNSNINTIRLSRDELEQLVGRPTFEIAVPGCFVRVLMEGDADRKKYRAAQVTGVTSSSTVYVFGNQTSTSKLLNLDLGIQTATYQMNTISNSPITEEETREWMSFYIPRNECNFITNLKTKQAHLTVIRAGLRISSDEQEDESVMDEACGPTSLSTHIPAVAARFAHEIGDDDMTEAAPVHNKRRVIRPQPKEKIVTELQSKLDERNKELLLLRKEHEQTKSALALERETNASLHTQLGTALCPPTKALEKMGCNELSALEQQIEEYRARVRALIVEKKKCVVCMDAEHQIIFYPCKHKAVCIKCANNLVTCPVCRAKIVDQIKPFDT
jgi:hypothetical protein